MWELIRQNERRSLLLMGALGAFTVLVGAVLGAAIDPRNGLAAGAILALGIWFVLTLFAYFAADRAVLAMSGAREITHKEFPRLWNVVEEIALAAAVPRPRIYLINDTAPNAFAVGRTPRNAAVAVTTGLLQKLTRDELTGVIAHEFAHIRNRDTKFMIRAAVMVGTIALMCDFFLRYTWFGGGTRSRRSSDSKGGGAAQLVILLLALVLAILAPIIARMLYLCISRRREYLADACSVEFTRNPEGLASALEKISSDQEVLEVANRATSPLYIANPIKSHEERAKNIFSTHPPITERIAILRSLAVGATLNDYEKQYRLIAKEGRKGGLYKPADLQQASAERAQRKPPGTHADGNVPVWELPGAMSQKGPVKSPQDLHRRMEPLARILACGDVARGTLPPDAALAALFGGGLGTLMMACACGQKLPVPEQPGEIPCTRCGAKLPVSREAVEAIARAKAQAGKQGAQVQTPAQLGVGVPPPPPPPLSSTGTPPVPPPPRPVPPHTSRIEVAPHGAQASNYGVQDADGDGKEDGINFEERHAGVERWKMFQDLKQDPSRGAKELRGSMLNPSAPAPPPPRPQIPPPPPATARAHAASHNGTPPEDPGDDDARRALIPGAFACACGFNKPIPGNFKGSRIKCPKCGELKIFYLVNGR